MSLISSSLEILLDRMPKSSKTSKLLLIGWLQVECYGPRSTVWMGRHFIFPQWRTRIKARNRSITCGSSVQACEIREEGASHGYLRYRSLLVAHRTQVFLRECTFHRLVLKWTSDHVSLPLNSLSPPLPAVIKKCIKNSAPLCLAC